MPALPDRDPFTTADATLAGWSDWAIGDRVARGRWVALRRGIYCSSELYAATACEPRSRHAVKVRAAQLSLPRRAVASGWSAALLLGLPLPHSLAGRAPQVVSLTTDAGRGRSFAGIELRAAPLPDEHVIQLPEAPVTSPARTALDLARLAPARELADALAVVDAVLQRGGARLDELVRMLDCFDGRRGVERARRVLDLADPRAESPLETHSRLFFVEHGIPMPRSQVEVRDEGNTLVGRVDFLWKRWNTIGEADGRFKYLDPDILYREKRREDRLRELGFEVVRWDYSDIRHNPRTTAARILVALERGSARAPLSRSMLSGLPS